MKFPGFGTIKNKGVVGNFGNLNKTNELYLLRLHSVHSARVLPTHCSVRPAPSLSASRRARPLLLCVCLQSRSGPGISLSIFVWNLFVVLFCQPGGGGGGGRLVSALGIGGGGEPLGIFNILPAQMGAAHFFMTPADTIAGSDA